MKYCRTTLSLYFSIENDDVHSEPTFMTKDSLSRREDRREGIDRERERTLYLQVNYDIPVSVLPFAVFAAHDIE
jgi:hypothetical protein